MILINAQSTGFTVGKYPDGTPAITANYDLLRTWYNRQGYLEIEWFYENMDELFSVYLIAKYLKEKIGSNICLHMPYIPNARMDRTKSSSDVATMKYFADMINALEFTEVTVLDPHSTTVENTIKNLVIVPPIRFIKSALSDIKDIDLIFYPDHGSESRYETIHKEFNLPYLSGYKQRNWKTGKIEKLQIVGDTASIEGKNILIVDDICSKGGTFLYAAKALKEYGANDIYLYVTHCENTMLDGEMINSGLIKKIYTTDSIYQKEHSLINVFPIIE